MDSESEDDEVATSKLPPFPNPPAEKNRRTSYNEIASPTNQPEVIFLQASASSSAADCNLDDILDDSEVDVSSTPTADKKFKKLIVCKLNAILRRLSAIEEGMKMQNGNAGRVLFPAEDVLKCFPLMSTDQLQEFDKSIEQEDEMKKFVLTLVSIGGTNEFQTVSKMLKRVVTNSVAELYSWHGAKGKKIFKNLNLVKGILEATRLQFPQVTEVQVHTLISNWLRHGKQRREREEKERAKMNSHT